MKNNGTCDARIENGTKIKNVVFDFGQVLVHFEPEKMARRSISDEQDARLVADVMFDRLYWDRLDDGTLTNAEVVSQALERLPKRLHGVAEQVFYGWIYSIPEIEGMKELLDELKARGKHLFLLSNISNYFAEHANEFDILKRMEKCIFSAPIGIVKPSREIFELLCRECEIIPDETLFVDDNPKNIASAEAFGIHGYLFDGNVAALRTYLEAL